MQIKASRPALKVALTYVVVAGGYILVSNELVKKFISDPDERINIIILKGWGFVLLTGGLLYLAVRRLLARAEREAEQRQRAEAAEQDIAEKLHLNEAQFKLIAEASADGLWMWNLESGVAYLSPRYWEITGYRAETTVANLDFFKRLVHPEDWPAVLATMNGHPADKSFGNVIEYRLLAKDGTVKWLWGRGKVIKRAPDGRPLRMVGTISDITERKLAEAQTRAFARLSEQLSISTDLHGAADAVTDTALELFNWDACFLLLYAAASDTVRELINKDTINNQRMTVPIAAGLLHPTPTLRRVMEQGGQLMLRRDGMDDKPDTRRFGDMNRPSISLMYVPLRHRGNVTGFLSVQSYRRNAYTHADLTSLQALADQCAGAMARIETEAALRASESRLHFLLSATPAIIYSLRGSGDFASTFVSSNAQAVMGHPPEAFINDLGFWAAHVHPDDLPAAATNFDRLAVEETMSREYRFRHADGTYRWMHDETRRVRDAQGRPQELVGHWFDITERKEAEAALRESEQKFFKIFQSSPMAISLSTAGEGRYLDVNEAFLRMLQRTRDEVIGHTAVELGVWAEPAQRAAVIAKLKEQGAVRDVELEIRGRSGRLTHILWSADAVTIGGASCLLGSSFDITGRKRAEEQMNVQFSALTAAANAIVITDRNGKIEWVNPAFGRLTGYSAAEAIGNYPRVLKSGQHPPAFYSNLWATVLTGNVWHGEIINRRKDGRLYTEDMTVTPVRSADGEIAHFVAIKQDITERRALEKQVQQAQKMEAIGTLAGGIAHDFNNILAAMFGYAYLLQQDTAGNAAAQESVGEILKATNRAKDLVQQILTFSRQREQKREVIRLDTVVKEATKFLRASLPAHIQIELTLSADAPAVLADPTQIYQVTMNLATNAQHAMEGPARGTNGSEPTGRDADAISRARSGSLTVQLESFWPDENFLAAHREFRRMQYARLTVADTGHGMDARTLEHIFEPFFTTKPAGKGTGLGLAVVHGIIQSHDGHITVESQVGRGTTFQLYFPAQKLDAALTETATGDLPRGRGQRILLVDDETALAAMFKRLLDGQNYQVTCSSQAAAAVGLFHKNPAQFDLVITDLTMPEMNGLDVARQVHNLRAEVPVILTSGFAPDLTPEKLREAGICELLTKPVSKTVLAAAVHRALSRPQSKGQTSEAEG